MSTLDQTPCLCKHTINFEKSYVFCTKKYGRPHLKNPPCLQNVRTRQTPVSADVFYGRPPIPYRLYHMFAKISYTYVIYRKKNKHWEVELK